MTSPLEQSFKKRLQLIAKERGLTPAEVWQNVITERFLVRLCRSSYQAHFILKGGVLLARHVDIGRETKDLDFAIRKLSNEIGVLQKVFNEITQIQMGDGFVFTNPVVGLLEHFHMEYPGARVKVEVCFGRAKFALFVDLGFGDLIQVNKKDFSLLSNSKGPLFEQTLVVNCYPLEFVFAEKLETAIYRGADNSRMKDFHDLYTLVSSKGLINKEDAKNAVRLVFNHRRTALSFPMEFDLSALETLQKSWERYRRVALASNLLPNQITEVIELINRFIQ